MKMRRAHWTSEGLELRDDEPGLLPSGWARLRVESCGICGSDLHLYRRSVPPLDGGVPGHEVCGSLLEGPTDLRDVLYAVEPLFWCGSCDYCEEGDRHLCRTGNIFGIQREGGLGEYLDVPVSCLHALDPATSPLVGSLAEPVAVGVRAIHLGEIESDSRVLVLGAGSIGLITGLLARDRAHEVAITARHPHQRAAAEALGLRVLGEDDVAEWATSAEPDVVIETVGGTANTLDVGIRRARKRARIVVLGLFPQKPRIDVFNLLTKELELIGSNTYGVGRRGPEFAAGVALLQRHASALAPLQTHQFRLDEFQRAFETADDKTSGAIKVSILRA